MFGKLGVEDIYWKGSYYNYHDFNDSSGKPKT
jgi:hypothetical protein